MIKITMLGAGSGFTQPLFTDIMNIEGLDSGEIALVDIDEKRLDIAYRLMQIVIEKMGKKKWKVVATTDRKKVLKNSNYIINTIEVSGVNTVKFDNDIPLKYGVKQCIGDTIGPGGIFKALRTIPSWIEILKDVEKLCPDALIMNYTNPMSMMTLAGIRTTQNQLIGLCHSVQGTSHQLASYCGVPYEELKWKCAGINHMAWFTELSHKGKNLYPSLFEKVKTDKKLYEQDPVRFETMLHFGYFVSESSGHFSEYVPYYRKRDDLIKKYCREGYLGGTSFYSSSWPQWRVNCDEHRKKQIKGEAEIPLGRSHEFASQIIEAKELNIPKVVYGSVLNKGLIENLPSDGVVEVACMIDRNGINPCRFGKLPPQLAALNISNMNVFECVVTGILEKNKDMIYYGMLIDPLNSAVCSPAEIYKMTDELVEAEKDFIPEFMWKK